MKPAYVIAQVEVTDPERFKAYLQAMPGILAKFGGRYVARGGRSVALENGEPNRRIVLIEFPSLERAQEWYNSCEYQEIKRLREGAATGSLVAIEGC